MQHSSLYLYPLDRLLWLQHSTIVLAPSWQPHLCRLLLLTVVLHKPRPLSVQHHKQHLCKKGLRFMPADTTTSQVVHVIDHFHISHSHKITITISTTISTSTSIQTRSRRSTRPQTRYISFIDHPSTHIDHILNVRSTSNYVRTLRSSLNKLDRP
jgi:hypothetical protein